MDKTVAITIAALLAVGAFFVGRVTQPQPLTVSGFELVERLSKAEKAASAAIGAARALEVQVGQLGQAHNGLAQAAAQAGASQQQNLLLMDKALRRIHGDPDWVAALAGARAEIAAEDAEANTPAIDPSEGTNAVPAASEAPEEAENEEAADETDEG